MPTRHGYPVHKSTSGRLISMIMGEGWEHSEHGWQSFDAWPSWNTTLHQQMYYRWLERAYKGGLRLMVMLAVNNEVICRLHVQRYRYRFCDDMTTVDDQIRALYEHEQGLTEILTLFSLLMVLVITIGLITLSLLSFNKRVKEIGIRKVNGATSAEILWMLNKQYARYVLLSFLIALTPAWYFMQRWLENYAYKTEISWWIFLTAGLATLLIALATTSWKSWQAASRNPVESLRSE